MTKVDLKSSLPSATVMILTVTATTTNGQPLNDEEIKRVLEGCDVLLDLDAGKRKVAKVQLIIHLIQLLTLIP